MAYRVAYDDRRKRRPWVVVYEYAWGEERVERAVSRHATQKAAEDDCCRLIWLATPIADLVGEDDQFFAGNGCRRLATIKCGKFEIEYYSPADPRDSKSMVIYHPAAMRRAGRRSVAAGGGVLGLSAAALLPAERRSLPPNATVADALRIAAALEP